MKIEKIKQTSDFSESVIPQDSVLLYVGKNNDGDISLRYKASDGRFYAFCDTTAADPNLVPHNIKAGVTIEGVTGSYTANANASAGDILQGATAYVNGQLIAGAIGSAIITVSANNVTITSGHIAETSSVVIPEAGSATVSSNIVSISSGYVASTRYVSVGLPVSGSTYTPGTSQQVIPESSYLLGDQIIAGDSNLISENIKFGATVFDVPGTYTMDGTASAEEIKAGQVAYASGSRLVGTMSSVFPIVSENVVVIPAGGYITSMSFPVGSALSSTTYTPTVSSQVISSGRYIVGDQVILGDTNLQAANIKYGATIFGVSGTFTGDATATAADIMTGKTAYVSGSAITGAVPTVSQIVSGNTVTVSTGYVTAQSSVVAEAGSALVVGNTVNIPTGYIKAARTVEVGNVLSTYSYNPSTSNQYIDSDTYLSQMLVISGDVSLIPDNIRNGAQIFGVTGTYTGIDTSDATATAEEILSGYTAYVDGVRITGTYVCPDVPYTSDSSDDSDSSLEPLDPAIIKYNVTVQGVTGTFTGDGDATSSDVLSGKKVYVKGSLVTGNIQTVQATLSDNVVTVPAGYIATSQTLTVPEAGSITTNNLTVTVPVGYIASVRAVTLTDANLSAANIKDGVSVFGVTGTFTHGATATAATILSGYTAYANGELITGEYVCPETSSESSAAVEEDVILGVVDAQGKFQPFSFSGTTPTNSGTAETVSNYNTWNSTLPSPTPTPSGSVDYYKCATVNTGNSTWTGYKAVLNNGTYTFETTETTGLTYTGTAPMWGQVLSADAKIRVSYLTGATILPDPFFYLPLTSSVATAPTGQTIAETGTVTFTSSVGALPSAWAEFSGSSYIDFSTDGFKFLTGGFAISCWAKGVVSDKQRCLLSYGVDQSNCAVAIMFAPNGVLKVIGTHDVENEWESSENTVDQSVWNHIGYVNFGAYEKIYLNGVLLDTFSYTREVRPGVGRIACLVNDTTFNYTGGVAGARYYNQILTANEISELATEFTPNA